MKTAQQLDMANIGLNSDANQYLTFILDGEEYGVDILRVQEIKGWDSVTPIPNTPQYIKGVINLRGTIVPIFDLRERFSLESMPYDAATVVIVLKVHGEELERTMGIVVDAVSEVYNIEEDELKASPDFGDTSNMDYVKGLATIEEKMIIVLDIDGLLNASVDDAPSE